MINGAHLLLYSKNATADRAFFRDILGFSSIDVGGGWLIFALPPAEMGIHPGSGDFVQLHADQQLLGALLYLMCDDLRSTTAAMRKKKIECSEVIEAQWGMSTTIPLPSGGRIGLYQPRHPTAFEPARKRHARRPGRKKQSQPKTKKGRRRR